ncbi:PQQ-binding-like beta-propeller repeat protein [Nonomuraea sp. NPDC050786]|uniref:nSTAND1 domain-containing NTPase n=1 Tax=Nonomuraea sp. NPDC050786 TaxID=3154840 RepID=UPI0033D79B39
MTALSPQETPDPLRRGIVRILDGQGGTAGTGFLVQGDLILTCAHVVDGGNGPVDQVTVEFATGERARATVDPSSWRGGGADLAVLVPEPGGSPRHALHLGSSRLIEGRDLRTFGFPQLNAVEGLAGEVHVLRGSTRLGGVEAFVLRSQEVTRGFSGAPVWDDELGAVVGMITAFVAPSRVRVDGGTVLVPADPGGRQTETAYLLGSDQIRRSCPALRLPDGTPYRRLDFFDAGHVAYYFGRERATDELLRRLVDRDFVVLVGTSGSGKSSLVRAGLTKGLSGNEIPGLAGRDRLIVIPGGVPLLDLALALRDGTGLAAERLGLAPGALDGSPELVAGALAGVSPGRLAESVKNAAPAGGLLLIIDQFERVFTECHDEAARTAFIETLMAAVGDTVKILLVLRADFYGRVMRHLDLSRLVKNGQVTVLPMDEDELRAAIEEPALVLRRRFQPALVDALVADVSGQTGGLPLLEFTLAELWARNAGSAVITYDSYEALGYSIPGPGGRRYRGVSGAIARAAEEVWQRLDPAERELVPQIFRTLITHEAPEDEPAGHATRYAGRRAWQAEWDEPTRAIAERFVAARLLVTRTDAVSGQPVFELAHEALTEAWPALRKWLAESTQFYRWYARDLAPAFREWVGRNEHEEYLLRDSMLPSAEQWTRDYPEGLSGPLRRYIALSLAAFDRRQAAERARNEELERALRSEQEQLRVARRSTEEANSLLWATRARQAEDDSLAVALALEATRMDSPPAFSQQVLAEIAYRPGLRRILDFGHRGRVRCVTRHGHLAVSGSENGGLLVWDLSGGSPPRRLAGHTGDVWGVAMSDDGRVCASGGQDRRVVLWDTGTGRVLHRFDGHEGPVRAVAISGGLLASASADGTLILWDLAEGRLLRRLSGHRDAVTSVAMRGGVAVSGSSDRTVIVWDPATGEVRQRLTGHTGTVWSVALTDDGRTALSGSSDRTVIAWDLTTGEVRHRLTGHTGTVWSVALTDDGLTALSGSSDRTVIAWDLTTGQAHRRLTGHTGAVTGVVAGPGPQALSCGDDHSLVVWDVVAGEPVERLHGHGRPPTRVAVSGDGRVALSAAGDGTLIVWDTATGDAVRRLLSQNGGSTGTELTGMALSRDSRTALSGSSDGTLTVWDTAAGHVIRDLPTPGSRVTAVALTPDGRLALGGTHEGTLIVWEHTSRQDPVRLRLGTEPIADLAAGDDGAIVLIGGAEGGLVLAELPGGRVLSRAACASPVTAVALDTPGERLFAVTADGGLVGCDLTDGSSADLREPLGLAGRSAKGLALSADGRNLAVTDSDGRLTLYDLATGDMRTLLAHRDGVNAVAMSADGTTACSGGADHRLIVWNTTRGALVRHIVAHKGAVTGIALSRDGRTALSASTDEDVTCWDVETGAPLRSWRIYEGNSVSLSADGSRAIFASDALSIWCWDPRTDAPLQRLAGHSEAVTSVVLSADGRTAVSGSVDRRVLLWNTDAGELVRAFHGHTGPVRAVALAPDGLTVASGSDDGSVIVWDTHTAAVVARLQEHRAGLTRLALDPTGRMIASGSSDGTLLVWDPRGTSAATAYAGHHAAITGLAFTADGAMLMSAASDGTIIVWETSTGEPVRRLDAEPVASLALGVDRSGPLGAVGTTDGSIAFWRVHPLGRLAAWTHANRLVRPLTCEEREAHHLTPLCDELGNPPGALPWPAAPEPVTSLTLGPPPVFPPQAPPTDLELTPGASVFDAVQQGRSRTWRLAGRRGDVVTVLVIPCGIDLEPRAELLGPGRPLATGDDVGGRRVRIGPVQLAATGTHRVAVSGQDTSAGGYLISCTVEGGA